MTPQGWVPHTLDQLGTVGRGRSRHRPRNDPSLYGGDYPFFQTGEVKAAEFYLHQYSQTYNEKGLAQSKIWAPGTLCITIAANIAETAILRIGGCFPDSVVGFVPDPKKADVRFVKYYIDWIKQRMQNVSRGTTQDNLSLDKLLTFEILTPRVELQRLIAAILSAYDDLIANNLRRIQILEEMAQNLYREWFVKFRVPGHEDVRMVGTPEKAIPEGWEFKPLGEACNLVMGQSPKSVYYNTTGEGLPFHQGVTDFGQRFPRERVYCTVENRVAEAGDILVSVRAPVGRINIAPTRMVIGRGLCAIRDLGGYQWLRFHQLRELFKEEDIMGGGTIFKAVTKKDMESLALLTPTTDLADDFTQAVEPFEAAIANSEQRTGLLREARDLLLPRLVSGQIDVSELDIDGGEEAA